MRPVWTLAKKELRQLVRDWRAALLLVVSPLVLILILGLLLGEGFGMKADDRTRVVIVDLDQGPCTLPGAAPGRTWAQEVRDDLKETAGIKIEVIDDEDEARRLVDKHKLAAVLIFKPTFSEKVNQCSFLVDGINPFHRDGVSLGKIDAELLKDGRQPGQSAIIDQVSQVTLLRVILPYMIGEAFEKLSRQEFIDLLGMKVFLPVPKQFQSVLGLLPIKLQLVDGKANLNDLLRLAGPDARIIPAAAVGVAGGQLGCNPWAAAAVLEAGTTVFTVQDYQKKVGGGVQDALREQFRNYELTGKTWAKLTKSKDPRQAEGANETQYANKGGTGLLSRGAFRYQVLVPAFTVLFMFLLALIVGWVFVTERRQGTLKRLRAAPITRGQVLLGKLLPCFLLSLAQGFGLLLAGKLVFNMRWGPEDWSLGQQLLWLFPLVFTTSLAAMGLAMFVAALARTELQVLLFGLAILALAAVGGCLYPREWFPEIYKGVPYLTPHGWALDAYAELLGPDPNRRPDLETVGQACGALAGFGVGFLGLAWGLLRLD